VAKGVVVAIVVFVLAGVASSATRPAIRLVSASDPVIVTGTGFRAKERVHVTLKAAMPEATWRRSVVTTRTGSFRAVIDATPSGRCGLNLRATGSRGSVATLKRPPLPACMP
jgi:hypothetical protein